LHEAVLSELADGQALFLRTLAERTDSLESELLPALWDLVWGGHVSNDTLAPLRGLLSGGSGTHRARPAASRSRYRRPGRPVLGARTGPPSGAGRWYLLPERDLDPTRRAAATADLLLERHGVVTRGAVVAEGPVGGFAGVYPVLAAMEERGAARRGYFVEGLGAAQFALPGAVDRLRAMAERTDTGAVVLASTDPANPYGAALSWPDRVVDELTNDKPGPRSFGERPRQAAGHRPGRKAGALVVLTGGELALYVERGGRTLLSFSDDDEVLAGAAKALAEAVHSGALGAMSIERADGEAIHSSPLRAALTSAGFRVTPRGLRLRG
jgi:ATP-dependent Lhr-like helicase